MTSPRLNREVDISAGYLGWIDGAVEVGITCMYWRKANAIHDWFVENCQQGVDDCGEYPVHPEQLAHLHKLCGDALAAYLNDDYKTAREIMTPRSGFFFGSTDIDQWWANELSRTISEIERVITLATSTSGVVFTYSSSW